MRITLNLASRPYVELGPIHARLRILMAALVVLAIPLWLLGRVESRRAASAQARFASVEQQVQQIENQRQAFQASMLQPANADVLNQSHFLNHMFQKKAFSWTAIMMDLENVLPSGVQVLNIDPVVSRKGEVVIHLRVSGDRARSVELVRNLEHSRRFLFPRLAGETAETTAQPGRGNFQPVSTNNVDFDILAGYNPLLPSETEKSGKKESKAADSAEKGQRKASLRTLPRHRPSRAASPAARKEGPR